MSKAASYLDWELSFREEREIKEREAKKKSKVEKELESKKESQMNSIGITQDDFRNYLKEWKKKNL